MEGGREGYKGDRRNGRKDKGSIKEYGERERETREGTWDDGMEIVWRRVK